MAYKPSKLLPLGFALLTLAFVLPAVLSSIVRILEPGGDAPPQSSLLLGTIKVAAGASQILLFIVGLSCAILGSLRNRRARKRVSW